MSLYERMAAQKDMNKRLGAPAVVISLEGLDDVARALAKLPYNTEKKVLAKAMIDSHQPMLKEAIRRAPRGMPRRHPNSTPLHQALVIKLWRTVRGLVWVKLGVDYTKNRVGHLVEWGHVKWRGGSRRKGMGHGGGRVAGTRFMTKSYDATKQDTVKDAERWIALGIELEAAKLATRYR